MKSFLNTLIVSLVIWLFIFFAMFKPCFDYGKQVGCDLALDTMARILDKQKKSPKTTCTKIIYNDTIVYIISHKTLITK